MTSTLDANELHETWLCFLNSRNEQTEDWLDTFLIKYLSLLCSPNENTKHSFSFQWRSSGNVLAHQLLSDVYQICEKLKASSVDGNDCDSISGPFKEYLLEGRGWKILWILEDIGIQTLLCLKDLVRLLICHVPVILSLPLGASNLPTPLQRKTKYLELEDCFYLLRKNRHLPQNINSRWSDEYIAKNRKNMFGKKRIRRKRAKVIKRESSSSSEEDPLLLEPCAIPASQMKTIKEVNHITAVVQRSLSEVGESDQEVTSTEPFLTPLMDDFWCYTISVIDYIHFILNLFQETVQIDNRNSHYNSSSSSLILEFSLTTLKDIHSGRYTFKGWTKEEISGLREQILKLAFLSATATYSSPNFTGAPNENEVISTLLTISEEVMLFHKDRETTEFVCCVVKGCLMLIKNAIELCSGDYAKVICVVKLFYENGTNLFHKTLSSLSEVNESTSEKNEIHSLISLVKGLIILLKIEKLSFLHPTNLNLDQDITNYLHHHNDMFGSHENLEAMHIEPECCIASLSSLLLKSINLPVSNSTCCIVVRLLKQCGICCCMNPGFVLDSLLKKILSYNIESQHLILTFIEKYAFPQLGLTKNVKSQCSCCFERLDNSYDIISCLLMDRLVNQDIKSLFYHLSEIGCTFWDSFGLYEDLLHSHSTETVEIISKHLVLVFTDGSNELRNQLFVRVILREFFQLPSKLPFSTNDGIKCKCFLSILHIALYDKPSSSVFIKFQGIQKLFSFILIKDFRQLALDVLKILMHLENNVTTNYDLNEARIYMPSSMTYFDFLHQHTQLFATKISLMLNSVDATSSDGNQSISEAYSMSEEKIECMSDLWKCYKDVVSFVKNENFSELSESVFESGHNLFMLLLENLSGILNLEELPEKKEVANYLLLMIQSLLTISIKKDNEVSTTLHILEVVKSNIQAHFPKSSEYQMLLFDVVLQCCFRSLPPAIPVRFLPKVNTSREVIDSTSSSDKDGMDSGSPDSYLGDTEGSSSCIFSSSAKYEVTHQSFIEHGEVVKMLFEVLMHFQKDNHSVWLPSAIYILQSLNKLCKECELNKMVLCEQDIPTLLLESFSSSLKAPEENIQLFEFQSAAMDLFVSLSELSMEPSNLRKFIGFFKMPFVSITLLLKNLNILIDNTVIHPIWNISFPCSRKPLSTIRCKKRQKSAFNIHKAFVTTRSNACAWNFGALSFPISEDTKWNTFNKGFSFSLWLKVFDVDHMCPTLIPGSTHFSTIKRQLSGNHRDLFGSDIQMLHLASVGSEKFLFELWYACSDRDLVIRIVTCDGIDVVCISKAICKSLFHCNTWHHLALNYTEGNNKSPINSRIQIVLDGVRENVFNLSFKRASNAFNDCHIILGHTELCSAETKLIYAAYSIGSFLFFKGNVLTRDIIFYLASLGPNMTNITDCAVEKGDAFVPKYTCPTVTSEVDLKVYMGMKVPSLEPLQDSLLCSYTADKVDCYLVYPTVTRGFFPIRYAFPRSGNSRSSTSSEGGLYSKLPSEMQALVLGDVSNYELHTFQYALQHAGGISIFLFLFAYVLEHSNCEEDSHIALSLIFKLLNKNTIFAEDFIRVKGYELLTQMIISEKCRKTNDLFKVFQQNCLTSCPLHEKLINGNLVQFDEPSVVSNSAIFSLMLKSIAFAKDTPESVLVLLFSTMDFLLDFKFANVQMNVEQINHVQTLSTLLWLLKRNYIMSEEYFSSAVANKICILMQSLLKYKFDESIFKDMCHFLLLLHKSSSAYVCHSRPSFFFFEIVDKLGGNEKVDTFSASVWFADELSTSVLLETYDHPFQASNDPSEISESTTSKHFAMSENSMQTNQLAEPKVQTGALTSESSTLSLDAEEIPTLPNGSAEICIGFLKLIHTFISSEDSNVYELALQLLQPEILIVLAYNENTDVCVFSLKVLGTYLKEASEAQKSNFLSIKGFHLLSNQLHLRQFDDGVFDACFSFVFDFPLKAINPSHLHFPRDTPSFRTMTWLPLLAILPNAVSNLDKCEKILLILTKFLQASTTVLMDLLENGLCMSIFRLLFQVTPLLKKDQIDAKDSNMNPCLKAISCLFQTITSALFSSKHNVDFNALLDILHLLSDLENKYTTEKGPKSRFVLCLRICQCAIYNVVVDFSKLYNHQSLRRRAVSQNDKTVWELLTELQESIGSYSTITVPIVDVAMEADPNMESRNEKDYLSHQTDVLEALLHVPIPVIVNRLELLLSEAAHFIVFKDSEVLTSMREKNLITAIFNFCIKGLVISIERATNKTDYTTIMCCLKETFKKELGSLMIFLMSPNQDLKLKEFSIEILTLHPSNKKILHLVLSSMARFENFLIFLNELQFCEDPNLRTRASVLCNLVLKLMENSPSLEVLGDTNLVEKCKREWTNLWNKDRKKCIDDTHKSNIKVFQKMEKHAQDISSIALKVTEIVFHIQINERRTFMEELKLKYYEEASERMAWFKLVEQMTHERAVWHIPESYPHSWELDPTEGPLRIRRRLKRCYINIEPRFLKPDYTDRLVDIKTELPFINLLLHHNEFPDSAAVLHRLHTHEQIQFTSTCKIVTAFEEAEVEILIGASCIHLIGEQALSIMKKGPISESWPFESIKEIVPRRYELQNNAFEVFLTNGLTYLIAFSSEKEFQFIWKQLESHGLPCQPSSDVSALTQLWRESSITNFEYLTQLNKLAGRSFNDLMQYPVFPFVLADYMNSHLNLLDQMVYRNLEKPVAVQHKYREKYYNDLYNMLKDQSCGPFSEAGPHMSSPYHYGSHYSNSGTVLHFLIRLLPYTYSFIKYQDNNFDIPDRTFHSVDTSWRLVTKESTSDVKELIPEFFFLPEFLSNKNGFDLGVRQSGIRVNDVLLPPWCKQNPRLFILIHRQALESDAVTRNIHNWIDLIFGFKQTGEAAINAFNVYQPTTYFGFDTNQWKDPITRKALKAMVKTLGQMPKQLFAGPHPMISLSLACLDLVTESSDSLAVIDTVSGLKWGNYVGSPSTGTPSLVWCRRQNVVIGCFLPLLSSSIFGLGENICLLLNQKKNKGSDILSASYIMSAALVSWCHKDHIVRIKLCRDQPAVPLLKGSSVDPVCLCASVPDCKELFVAHSSGIISVYNLSLSSTGQSMIQEKPPLQLNGHTDSVTSIYICKTFSIFVSSSKDSSVIVWDLNRLSFVHCLSGHSDAVQLVTVSDTLGDIASVSTCGEESNLMVHTINGETVGSVKVPGIVTSICYSTAPEGTSVNVIATGLHSGRIRLWSSWDLKPVREIICDRFCLPIKCLVFSMDNQHLFASNENGTVAVWEKPSKGLTSVPRLLVFN